MNNERSLAKEITEGFEALKSMRNNEPVAWMCPTGLEYKQRATDFMYNDALYDTKLNWIPLYTHPVKEEYESFDRTASHMAGEYVSHPVKELTDEEIDECLYSTDWSYDPHSFARAILRKAQEK